MLRPSDYTIAWICALPTELQAAEATLDAKHPMQPAQPGDDNVYSFGSIGSHNVVVASLPAGRMGNNSAATVVKDLSRSFQAIKFCLMVGIGGGAPQNLDIRLGDIAVSEPDGAHGGVVQYDFGKTQGDGRCKRTGSLNTPHRQLLTTINRLKSREVAVRLSVQEHMSAMVQVDPTMTKNIEFPGTEHDQLYEAAYEHVGPKGTTCHACDARWIRKRHHRETQMPFIYYGNMASGNQVMRDAKTRDQIALEEKVICFEMEAAGLLDSFQCLVVRGICDYADSHKNDRWQPYAAAAAAAYAKAVLLELPSTVPNETRDVQHDLAARNIHWLVPKDPSPFFTGRESILHRLKEFLVEPADNDSYNSGQRRFILTGMGGVGKSELCRKFAAKWREKFWGVFWVDASSPESAKQDFSRVAKACGLPDSSPDGILYGIKQCLSKMTHTWLLVLDNADDPTFDYETYFPLGRGCIILTSRVRDFHHRYSLEGHGYESLDNLESGDAVKLLLLFAKIKKAKWDVEQSLAEKVVRILGYHALAITLAGAFIGKGCCSLSGYPQYFLNVQKSKMTTFMADTRRPGVGSTPEKPRGELTEDSHYDSVVASFDTHGQYLENLSMTQKEAKCALELLNVLAFMHFENVSEDIFSRAWAYSRGRNGLPTPARSHNITRLFPWHHKLAQSPGFMPSGDSDNYSDSNLRQGQTLLEGLSLIAVDSETHTMSIHPLLHAWTRHRMSNQSYENAWETSASILALATEEEDYEKPQFKDLQSHIETCLDFFPHDARQWQDMRASVQTLHIFYRLGSTLDELRSDRRAKEFIEKAYDAALYLLEEKSESLLALSSLYATTLQRTGNNDKAIEVLENALGGRLTAASDDSPIRLTAMHTLAYAYAGNDQHLSAIELLTDVVRIRKLKLNSNDPDLVTSQLLLARAYTENGQNKEAIKRIREILETPDLPQILTVKYALARAYRGDEQYDHAISILEEVADDRKKTLRLDHPDLLRSQDELARSYAGKRRYQAAADELENVVKIRKVALPAEDPQLRESERFLMEVRNLAKKYGSSESKNLKASP